MRASAFCIMILYLLIGSILLTQQLPYQTTTTTLASSLDDTSAISSTSASLSRSHHFSLKSSNNPPLTLSPDWTLLAIIIILCCLTILFTIISCWLMGHRDWISQINLTIINNHNKMQQPKIGYKLKALQDKLQLLSLQQHHNKQNIDNTTTTAAIDQTSSSMTTNDITQGIHSVSIDYNNNNNNNNKEANNNPLSPILLDSIKAEDELLKTEGPDIYLNEFSSLSSSSTISSDSNLFTMDNFDVHSITALLEENQQQLNTFIHAQQNMFLQLYSHMSRDLSQMKSLLAIKLSVCINKNQQGFIESIDRLISGELLARESHHETYQLYSKKIHSNLEELISLIRNLALNIDDNDQGKNGANLTNSPASSYNIFPIKIIVTRLIEYIEKMELLWKNERYRRKELSAYTEIVGRPIVDLLTQIDTLQKSTVDDYLSAFLFFSLTASEILNKLIQEDFYHCNQIEKIDDSQKLKLDYEKERYTLIVMKLLRDLQTQLTYLNEKLLSIEPQLYQINQQHILAWTHIQGPLLEQRCQSIIKELDKEKKEKKKGHLYHSSNSHMFRGINRELAKVLTTLLTIKNGVSQDDKGQFIAKEVFDPFDPFSAIFDQGVTCHHPQHGDGFISHLYEEDEDEDEDDNSLTKKKKKKKAASSKLATIEEMKEGEETDEEVENKKKKKKKDKETKKDKKKKAEDKKDVLAAALASSLDSISAQREQELETLMKKRESIVGESKDPAELSAVNAEIAALLENSKAEAAHLASAVLAINEKENEEKQLEFVELQRLKEELDSTNSHLHHLHSSQARELRKLNHELTEEEAADAARYTLDLTAFDLVLEKMNMPETQFKEEEMTEEEIEIKELMDQGITDSALIRQLLLQKHAMERQGRRDELTQKHAQELTNATAHRMSLITSIEEEENFLAVIHKVGEMKMEPAAASESQMIVSYVDGEGRARRVELSQVSHSQLCAFDVEHQERLVEEETQNERNSLIQRLATLADSVILEDGQELQDATSVLETQQAQEMRLLDAALAELPECQRVPNLSRLVEHVMRDRHHNHLNDLMKKLAADRNAALMKAIHEAKEKGETDPDIIKLNKAVDEEISHQRSQAIKALEQQHRSEMLAAYQQRHPEGDIKAVVFNTLDYDAVDERSAELAASLTNQPVMKAADVIKKQNEILNDPNLSEAEKAEAIKHLLSGLHRFDDRLALEKRRQAEIMKKKIEERQRKKREAAEAAAKAAQIERDKAIEAENTAAALKRKAAQQSLVEGVKEQKRREEARLAAEAAERQQLTDRLKRIEAMVLTLGEEAIKWRKQQCYIDDVDAHDDSYRYHEGDTLVECPDHTLPPHALALVQFSQQLVSLWYIQGLIHSANNSSPITIRIAASLPAPQFTQTAYMRSFHWSEPLNILYIRQERLYDAAAFNQVIIYALAHINTVHDWRQQQQQRQRSQSEAHRGNMNTEDEAESLSACWDDRDPRFLRHLHRLQRIMIAEFFFAATQTSSRTPTALSSSLLSAAINSLTQLHPLPAPSSSLGSASSYAHLPFFSQSRLLARMNEYHAFKEENELQSYLISLEQQMRDKEQQRQREAKKQQDLIFNRLTSMKAKKEAEYRSQEEWLAMSLRQGQELTVKDMEEISDELNAELLLIIQQLYTLSQSLAEHEKKNNSGNNDAAAVEASQAENVRLKRQISLLTEEKHLLESRLQTISQAQTALQQSA